MNDATITASVKSKLLWNAHTDSLGHIATDTNDVVGVNNEISNKPEASAKVKAESAKAEQAVSG